MQRAVGVTPHGRKHHDSRWSLADHGADRALLRAQTQVPADARTGVDRAILGEDRTADIGDVEVPKVLWVERCLRPLAQLSSGDLRHRRSLGIHGFAAERLPDVLRPVHAPDHLLPDAGVLLRSWLRRSVRCLAVAVVDEEFRHPRLAALYDALDPDRGDLQPYVDLVAQLGAHRVLDVGCGTGELGLLFAAAGCDVVGVDPAAASLAVARAKPEAERVRWIDGDATSVSVTDRDIALLTGNTAQAITDSGQWAMTLEAIHASLRPGGHLAFETRDPVARACEQWTRAATHRVSDVPGTGRVESWVEVTEFDWPLVTICWTWVFAGDEASLTSSSTLRFRERSEVVDDLHATGFDVIDPRRRRPSRSGARLPRPSARSSPAARRLGARVRTQATVLFTGLG